MSDVSYSQLEIATTALGKTDTLEPGKSFTLGVTVTNIDDQQALDVEVSLDHLPEDLIWNAQPIRLALFPKQSADVTFKIKAPETALPRLVKYTLRVSDPTVAPNSAQRVLEHQPLTLRILPLDRTESSTENPSFYLEPTSSSSQPQQVQPLAGVPVQVWVNNRSDLVDRFRLQCDGLPKDWEVSISYPQDALGMGLMVAANNLGLNPGDRGQILLMIKPPAHAQAGVYVPTLQLISENKPTLKLLHLLYLEVPATYLLQPSLHSLRGQFRKGSALFELQLLNSGNSPREIDIEAEALDEADRYQYALKETHVKVLPQSTQRVKLEIFPQKKWRRPWYGSGHFSNFRFKLKDKENHPLPVETLQGNFTWLARPWWQRLLCLLLALGLVGGVAGLIWWFLLRSPTIAKTLKVAATRTNYSEINDAAAKLNMQVPSPRLIKTMRLTGMSPEGDVLTESIEYDFHTARQEKKLTNETLPHGLRDFCTILPRKNVLDCHQVHTGATLPETYHFQVDVVYQHRQKFSTLSGSSGNVVINPVPLPTLKANKLFLQEEASSEAEPLVDMVIWQPQDFESIELIAKTQEGDIEQVKVLSIWEDTEEEAEFANLNPALQEQNCSLSGNGKQLTCQIFETDIKTVGTFQIEATFRPQEPDPAVSNPAASEQEAEMVTVSTQPITREAVPMNLVKFLVNAQDAQSASVIRLPFNNTDSTVVSLDWAVSGGSTMKVELLAPAPAEVGASDTRQFAMTPGDRKIIGLRLTDGAGKQVTHSVEVEAIAPAPPSPEETAAAMGAAIADTLPNNAEQGAGTGPFGINGQAGEGEPTFEVPSSVDAQQPSPVELPPAFNE